MSGAPQDGFCRMSSGETGHALTKDRSTGEHFQSQAPQGPVKQAFRPLAIRTMTMSCPALCRWACVIAKVQSLAGPAGLGNQALRGRFLCTERAPYHELEILQSAPMPTAAGRKD